MSEPAAIKLMRRVRERESAPARIGGYRNLLLPGHDNLLLELTPTTAISSWSRSERSLLTAASTLLPDNDLVDAT